MAKEHIGDLVVDELIRRRGVVQLILRRDYKSVRPLGMKPVSNTELVRRYDSLTPEQWDEVTANADPVEVEDYRNKMENLKIRRGDYA